MGIRFLFCFFFGLSVSVGSLLGQSNDLNPDYNRNALTPVLLKNDSLDLEYSLKPGFQDLKIPKKFDDNKINDLGLPVTLPSYELPEPKEEKEEKKEEDTKSGGGQVGNKLVEAATNEANNKALSMATETLNKPLYDSIIRHQLSKHGVNKEIVDSLYNADSAGRYSMDKLIERAKYNLTDAEVIRLKNTAKGFEQGSEDYKWASKILSSNYLVGFYFHDIQRLNKKDGKNGGDGEEEKKFRGYKALVSAFLYRLDFNDSIQAVFYNQCWAGANSDEQSLKEALDAREEMEYPLEKAGNFHFTVISRDYVGPDKGSTFYQKRLQKLPQKSLEKTIEKAEQKVRAFKVQSPLIEYNPFPFSFGWSKIGTKEGLQPDDRYFVYEYVSGDSGVKKKQKGVVRATNVVNNDTLATGNTEPSKFIQTAGWGLGKGMLMEQKPDRGISIALGYMNHGRPYLNARLELRISKSLNLSPSWHAYGDYSIAASEISGFEKDEVNVYPGNDTTTYETDGEVRAFGFGVSKEFYFLKWFHISPYLGLRREKAKFSDSTFNDYLEENLTVNPVEKKWTVDAGARFGFNLTHWLKIRGSWGFSPLSYSTKESLYGKDVNPEMGSLIPGLKAGDSNPFYLKRDRYKWEIMLRVNF